MSLAEFFAMGGYGGYVWVSYGLTLLIVVFNLVVPIRRERRLRREIAHRRRRER